MTDTAAETRHRGHRAARATSPATTRGRDGCPVRLRRLADRFLPRGAIVLSILTLAYFAMRQIQNRVLANAFGLGTDLDVYYVAVRIPEVALDVLVAAGLTAPFVPIFSQLRRTNERRRRTTSPGRP